MPLDIEPCGCEESNALREILEGLVEYNDETSPCDKDCECGFCEGRELLAHLKEERAKLGKRRCSSCDPTRRG